MVVVIVPAFEEQERIGAVLATLPTSVDRVVVVDDASKDRTASVAEGMGVAVVRHEKNRGVGGAIATGYRWAMAQPGEPDDAFVVMAADGQMDPHDLPLVAGPVVRGEAGYVKGNRFAHPDASVIPIGRRIGGQVFSVATTLALGRKITDSQCGYTALARWACERLDLGALYPGYGYPNDMLGALTVAGVPIVEVTVRPIYAGEKSGLGLRHLPRIVWLVARAGLRARADVLR